MIIFDLLDNIMFAAIGILTMLVGLFIQKKTKFAYWKFMLITAAIAFLISAVLFFSFIFGYRF